MAPKLAGTYGRGGALRHVEDLRAEGLGEAALRQRLRDEGYAAPRISQLLKGTRPTAPVAAPRARPAAALAPEAVEPTVDVELVELGIQEDDAVTESLDQAEFEWHVDHAMEAVGPHDDASSEEGDVGTLLNDERVLSSGDSESGQPGPAQPSAQPSAQPALPPASAVRAPGRTHVGPPLRKPARGPWPNEQCPGLPGSPCTFHAAATGRPARIHRDRGETHCLLCDGGKCRATGKDVLANVLEKFRDKNLTVHGAALERLRQHLGQSELAALQDPWAACLQERKSVGSILKPKAREHYAAEVKRDRRVARRKVFFPEKMRARATEAEEAAEMEHVKAVGHVEDLAANDTGLPSPKCSIPRLVEAWCKQGSWGVCEKCHSLCPRPLRPMDARRIAKPVIPSAQCTACQKGEHVPQPEDVPPPLRGLKPKVLEALRPLEIDTGVADRAPFGYRVHTAMICFAWEPVSVEYKIAHLEKRKDRRAAEAAYLHLMGSTVSAYRTFIERHEDFLKKHGDHADRKLRKRPLRFLEEEGLECCLWPHLYHHKNLCETVARATHETRQQRGHKRRAEDSNDDEDAETEGERDVEGVGDAVAGSKMGRIKRGFIRKVLSPVIGFGADYQLLHFVYDLSMWTTIGTKRNIAARTGVPLRLLLKGSPWTPQYWRVRHQALVDMQRQCGNATLFRTRAPYERSFPYHRWILHEQEVIGASPAAPRRRGDASHGPHPDAVGQGLLLRRLGEGWAGGPDLEGAPSGAPRAQQHQHRCGSRNAP